jgi:hypothetical protein
MKFMSLFVFAALSMLATMGVLKAEETPDSSKGTSSSEAQYAACIKTAHALQKRFSECATKECRDLVTEDFQAWSAKCFKE